MTEPVADFDEQVRALALVAPSYGCAEHKFLARGTMALDHTLLDDFCVGELAYANPLYAIDGAIRCGAWIFVAEVRVRPNEELVALAVSGTPLPPLRPEARGEYHICAFHARMHYNFGPVPGVSADAAPHALFQWVAEHIVPLVYRARGGLRLDTGRTLFAPDSTTDARDALADVRLRVKFLAVPVVY